MNPDRREEKDSIHLESGFLAGAEELGEEITRLDLHRGAEQETLSGSPPAEAANVCARCGAELQSLDTVAWCLRCGYTKQLHRSQETQGKIQEDLDVRRYLSLLHAQSERQKLELQLSTLKRGETYRGTEMVPEWLAVLVCGLLICVIGSFTVAMNLRSSPEPRLIWCLAQAGIAFAVVVGSHAILGKFRKLRFRQLKMLFRRGCGWWPVPCHKLAWRLGGLWEGLGARTHPRRIQIRLINAERFSPPACDRYDPGVGRGHISGGKPSLEMKPEKRRLSLTLIQSHPIMSPL